MKTTTLFEINQEESTMLEQYSHNETSGEILKCSPTSWNTCSFDERTGLSSFSAKINLKNGEIP